MVETSVLHAKGAAHSSPPQTKRLWVEYPAQRKMKSRYGCQTVQSATSCPFWHSTLRDLASGQLPGRASTMGRAAGGQGKLLLHRRYARHHGSSEPGDIASPYP